MEWSLMNRILSRPAPVPRRSHTTMKWYKRSVSCPLFRSSRRYSSRSDSFVSTQRCSRYSASRYSLSLSDQQGELYKRREGSE